METAFANTRTVLVVGLGWAWVVFAAFMGVVVLAGGSIAAAVMCWVSAVAASPPLWRYLKQRGLHVPVWARALIGAGAFVVSPVVLSSSAPSLSTERGVSTAGALTAPATAKATMGENHPVAAEEPLEEAAEPDKAEPISQADAVIACKPEIRRRLAHPSTADFAWTSDLTTHGDTSMLTIKLTA